MKAISLWQPWASAIALGIKTWETRSWPAGGVRGRIAIHAALRWTPDQSEFLWDVKSRFPEQWEMFPLKLPLGAIVCTANLVDCRRTELVGPVDTADVFWGNWSLGRFAWKLEDVRPLTEPVRWAGRQRFFHVPNAVLELGQTEPYAVGVKRQA